MVHKYIKKFIRLNNYFKISHNNGFFEIVMYTHLWKVHYTYNTKIYNNFINFINIIICFNVRQELKW